MAADMRRVQTIALDVFVSESTSPQELQPNVPRIIIGQLQATDDLLSSQAWEEEQ